jgi:predicted amidohydrolase
MKKLISAFLLFMAFGIPTAHAAEIKVAAVSFHSKEMAYNIPQMMDISVKAAQEGAKLIVFPEMSSTGFLYSSFAEARLNMDTFPGKATEAFGRIAEKHYL